MIDSTIRIGVQLPRHVLGSGIKILVKPLPILDVCAEHGLLHANRCAGGQFVFK